MCAPRKYRANNVSILEILNQNKSIFLYAINTGEEGGLRQAKEKKKSKNNIIWKAA